MLENHCRKRKRHSKSGSQKLLTSNGIPKLKRKICSWKSVRFYKFPVRHEIGVTCSSVTQFPIILLNDLWAWPDDVIRLRPFRLSFLWLAVNGRPMGVAENLGELSCAECTTVKMETRHPTKRSFGNKFPLIYNNCGVTAA